MAKAGHWRQGYRRFIRSGRAVSALEYALLVGVIAVGAGNALTAFNNSISAETAPHNVQTHVAVHAGRFDR